MTGILLKCASKEKILEIIKNHISNCITVMIPYRNCEIFASVLFFFVIKIFCSLYIWYRNMYKQPTLACIPEHNEIEEEQITNKWVPKKKHEILKAKYKCLKKLFQIYDASVIGILPQINADIPSEEVKISKKRKKRSHRTKTDACMGTNENTSRDNSSQSKVSVKNSVASVVLNDLKITHCSCSSSQVQSTGTDEEYVASTAKESTACVGHECGCTPREQHPLPYLIVSEKKKLTRFQIFIQRICGIYQERNYNNYPLPHGRMYAASENMINTNYDRRRRRGLRFRNIRRPKNMHSEMIIRDSKSPDILTYVQSVQRSCLMDKTPRQCPIVGCRMMSYGIINYNDHLNMCHFPERKYICHYCHEGFDNENDKLIHENEHIGISKLNNFQHPNASTSNTRTTCKMAPNPQTDADLTNFKLKKIVSFFDKINDADHILTSIKKNMCSETNMGCKADGRFLCEKITSASCGHFPRRFNQKVVRCNVSKQNYGRPAPCTLCGERPLLSTPNDAAYQPNQKYSKFEPCAAAINCPAYHRMDLVSEDGKIQVHSTDQPRSVRMYPASTISNDSFSETSRRSYDSLSCDPSTNIVYYKSLENLKKPSVVNNLVHKVRSGFSGYKWEPETKIIHV